MMDAVTLRMDTQEQLDRGRDVPSGRKIVVALLWKCDGGMATSINDLALALDPDRFEVIFIFLKSQGKAASRLAETNRVFYLPRGWAGVTRFLPTVIRLARILRTHRIDVLHCHNPRANLYGTLAGAWVKTPAVLVQYHGLRRTRSVGQRILNLFILRKAAKIIGVAEAVTKDVVRSNWRVPQERLLVLENSVDYGRFAHTEIPLGEARRMLGVPADAVVFGTIGRLAPTKGLPYLVDAFGTVKRHMPSAHLVLLGDGPERDKLERLVADTPYSSSVHFLGYRPNIEELLKGMDVFVLASVAEGMPRVILEAMAAGVPCVSTAVGGIPEMLDGGRLGVLVQPRNASELTRAMQDVAAWPLAKRQDHVEQARQYVRTRYSHDVVQTKLASLYEQEFAAWQNGRRRAALPAS
jgi:glycosyltransferase involved in cell wall biosynthesis